MEVEVTDRGEKDDCWNRLPYTVLTKIFGHLSCVDRLRAGQACRWWHYQLSATALWKRVAFNFSSPKDGQQLRLVQKYGPFMQDVSIDFDSGVVCTLEYVSHLFSALSEGSAAGDICLSRLSVGFISAPSIAHRWLHFTDGLIGLFRRCTSLISVDLHRYYVAFDDNLLEAIACSRHLKRLDIQNACLVTQVTPSGMRSFLESCKNIEELSTRQASFSEECIDILTRDDRSRLIKLDIALRGQEKYIPSISWDRWTRLAEVHPELEVTLAFDVSCPIAKLFDMMAPDIPVTVLHLHTQTAINEELRHISRVYARTLKVLVIDAEPSPDFEQALLHLCSSCASLQKLHVINSVSTSSQLALYAVMSTKSAIDLRFGPQLVPCRNCATTPRVRSDC